MKREVAVKWMVMGAVVWMGIGAWRAEADTFGSGLNQFTIDFVSVTNAGNGNDVDNPYGNPGDQGTPFGGVGYDYRMSKYEISSNQIAAAVAGGLTGVTSADWTGDRPATSVTWYEAALFVNWLNTNGGYSPAYNFINGTMYLWDAGVAWTLDGTNLYRNKDTFYFLPSEDEWYKAAYHKNDGVTSNYWDYATGSNGAPVGVTGGTNAHTAVYWDPYGNPVPSGPTNVNLAGGLSPFGTMGQDGNVYEWMESAYDGTNSSTSESRAVRGGGWGYSEAYLRASFRFDDLPSTPYYNVGFRVASVLAPIPEPGAMAGMALCASAILGRRVWKRSL